MALARIIFHRFAHNTTLGVEDGKSRTNFVREREQVQFSAQATVISFGRFLESFGVIAKALLVRPCGSIDSLELLVLFRTPPVGSGKSHQFDAFADHARVGQVWPAAQILPHCFARLRVDVVINGELGATDLNTFVVIARVTALEADEFEFVGFVRKFETSLVLGDYSTHETLTLTNDAAHFLVQSTHILRSKCGLDVKVVVKAVSDGRTNTQLGFRVDALNGLCEHMRGGMAKDVEAVLGIDGHSLDGVTLLRLVCKVTQFAVDAHGDNRPVGEQLEPGVGLFE